MSENFDVLRVLAERDKMDAPCIADDPGMMANRLPQLIQQPPDLGLGGVLREA